VSLTLLGMNAKRLSRSDQASRKSSFAIATSHPREAVAAIELRDDLISAHSRYGERAGTLDLTGVANPRASGGGAEHYVLMLPAVQHHHAMAPLLRR